MSNGNFDVPVPHNEPVLDYAPGSPERAALVAQLEKMSARQVEIPARIGGRKVRTGKMKDAVLPRYPEAVVNLKSIPGLDFIREERGMLTIGAHLWRCLNGDLLQTDPAVNVFSFAHRAEGGVGLMEVCNASRELIPAWQMRGIDEDAEIVHLYTPATLGDEVYRPRRDMTDFLEPTRAFLAKAGFYGVDRGDLVQLPAGATTEP